MRERETAPVWGRLLTVAGIAAWMMCAAWAAAAAETASPPAAQPDQHEAIEADVSTRQVAVESDFAGTQFVVFGTVINSRQASALEGYYDIAVVIAGPKQEIVTRRKTNVAGVWINTSSVAFKDIASYYTVTSTRPVEEIAPKPVLWQHGIGFENMRMASLDAIGAKQAEEFRSAVLRIKKSQGLYQEEPRGVDFIGRSLFRATVDLPANVPVGEFTAWVYLFRKGELLASYKTRLDLQREGFERLLYRFAMRKPFYYGLGSVGLAVLAGLVASTLFRRD